MDADPSVFQRIPESAGCGSFCTPAENPAGNPMGFRGAAFCTKLGAPTWSFGQWDRGGGVVG